jgi:hypothetical protein
MMNTVEWNARNAEHLLNRAGFGGTPRDVQAAVAAKPEGLIDVLMTAHREWERLEPVLIEWEDFDLDPTGQPVPPEKSRYKGVPRKKQFQIMDKLRATDRLQFMDYSDRWFRAMISYDDPLRDRMTLFWHGFFTTASPVVKRKYELLNQHQFLRANALGSFRDLLHGIAVDAAMLQYLDNNTNVKEHPNENFARELMELYSLGEGNYSEVDVREAARALTGCHANPAGRYEFRPEHHDDGEKTILGVTGKMRVGELVDVLLAQEACARWVAYRILRYLEGAEPSAERLDEYADFLRESDYAITPFLRRLLLDPTFYRDEIVGARVESPVDFIVGMCRKLDLVPADHALYRLTEILGEGFYLPPTVKGWDGGEAWITNDRLMQRGNCAGVLLGALAPSSMSGGELEVRASGEAVIRLGRIAQITTWKRGLNMRGMVHKSNATTDSEIVDAVLRRLLAVEPPAHLRAQMLAHLERERVAAELGHTPLLETSDVEMVLRRLSHLILSLPEAQLS